MILYDFYVHKYFRVAKDFDYTKIIMMKLYQDQLQVRGLKNYPVDYPLKGSKNGLGLKCSFEMLQYINDTMDVNIFNETMPFESRDGFQLMVHDPFEVISESAVNFFAPTGEIFHFHVEPEITSFDESFVDFTPEERNCWLPDEKKLDFFKVYNRPNCEHECMAAATLKQCGCVQFYMVRNESTRICSAAEETCFRQVEESSIEIKDKCKCYHSCDSVRFDVKLLRTGLKG